MKKFISIGIAIIFLTQLNVSGQKNILRFNQDGEFKIVQFTDTHLQNSVSELVLQLIDEIIEAERPDLVVITGDIIVQDSVDNLVSGLAAIFKGKEVYWAVVFGNHDCEKGPNRKMLSRMYCSLPYNLNSSTGGIKGVTNFILPIAGEKSKRQALLFFFDSNAYNPLKDGVKGSYGWIDFSQIQWYRNRSAFYTRKNNGTPLPSLSFFHIPLPEYEILWENDSASCIGSKHEEISCPPVNSGMYTAMLECGDIFGMFVGHDHINDYIGILNGIALAYGRFSGANNTYGHLTPGARVIVLKEGRREFDTWIREKGGNIVYRCRYPESFIP
jgi:hypothetical protein